MTQACAQAAEQLKPLVTVLVNCFNGEKFLVKAVQSVLDQTYQNWELVFWDNCSTDRSAEVYQSFTDSRLRYFLAPHHTVLYEARNYALEYARGDLIAFLDVDDWWDEDKLSLQVELFDSPQVGFVYGNYWLENESKGKTTLAFSKDLPEGRGADALLTNYAVGMLTLMIRRSLFCGDHGGFDPRFLIVGDFDLVIRMAGITEYRAVQKPIAHYRWHGANITSNAIGRHAEELQMWLKKVSHSTEFQESPALTGIRNLYKYKLGQAQVQEGRRWQSFKTMLSITNRSMQVRLFAFLILPRAMHRGLRA